MPEPVIKPIGMDRPGKPSDDSLRALKIPFSFPAKAGTQ